MKRAFIFPGQSAQFPGMAKDLYDQFELARKRFTEANEILGFDISKVMFEGTAEDLRQTKVTQPAIFLHSVILKECLLSDADFSMVAGHSLGEFSALVAANVLSFEDGLKLVAVRANAMQKACENEPSTMAAVLAMEDHKVEEICASIDGIVVPANYNCPGQLVISGEVSAVEKACEQLKEAGAKRALLLQVGGAFHSPLMESAKTIFSAAVQDVEFSEPSVPVYQNVTAAPETDSKIIKENIVEQLTSPVRWTQSVQQMIADGAEQFTEVGPGKVLFGLMRKINREVSAEYAILPKED